METSNLETHKNTWTNYIIVLGVVLVLILLWYFYLSSFTIKQSAETQKTAEEKRREELIQSLTVPSSVSPTAQEAAQIPQSLSTPQKQTIQMSERKNLIKSLTE